MECEGFKGRVWINRSKFKGGRREEREGGFGIEGVGNGGFRVQ